MTWLITFLFNSDPSDIYDAPGGNGENKNGDGENENREAGKR